jgi:hypothetical protein
MGGNLVSHNMQTTMLSEVTCPGRWGQIQRVSSFLSGIYWGIHTRIAVGIFSFGHTLMLQAAMMTQTALNHLAFVAVHPVHALEENAEVEA